jgi:hypothetical protein
MMADSALDSLIATIENSTAATDVTIDDVNAGSLGTATNPVVARCATSNSKKTFSQGGGYGILIVDSSVKELGFSGHFLWHGIIIVKGENGAKFTGGGGRIYGAALIRGNNDSTQVLKSTGGADIRYCKTYVEMALNGTGVPVTTWNTVLGPRTTTAASSGVPVLKVRRELDSGQITSFLNDWTAP